MNAMTPATRPPEPSPVRAAAQPPTPPLRRLRGAEKAAILFLCLGEERGSELMRKLSPEDIAKITRAVARLGVVQAELVEMVLAEFSEGVDAGGGVVGSLASAEAMLRAFLPEEQVEVILRDIRGPMKERDLWAKFSAMNEAVIATYLKGEHEQTAAAILSNVDTEVAAKVLPLLGEDMMRDVVERMIRMEAVPHHMMQQIEETLQAMDKLHKAGVFSEFGLSNYAAWEVVRIVGLCEAAGYVKPTVYQGMYNAFTRGVEAELLPAIRACGMRFYAYNITAGGLLTGKHTKDSDPTDGRFNKDTLWGRAYRQRFFNDTMFSALEALKAALAALDGEPISPYAAVIRYLAFHSKLTPDDGLILGGSCAKHIEVNAASLRDGPLPQSIVDVIDSAAEATSTVCPPYFRGHSNCAADA